MDSQEREIDVIESIHERIGMVGVSGLTEPERLRWAVWVLEGETANGGFDQFFHNSSGALAHSALEGLIACGAHKMAAIFQSAMALFPGGQVPADQQQRSKILHSFSESQENTLSALSNEFYDYPDKIGELMDAYVQKHNESFLGPRTLVERWNSRRAYGLETRPQGISDWDLDKEATSDAKSTNRKCPTCGQPAPEYRRTCKRCGYPYGRGSNLPAV